MPLAAEIGCGSKAVAEGRSAGQKVCFCSTLAADFWPDSEAVAEGCAAGLLLFTSCRRLQAWSGGGSGGTDGKFASLRLRALPGVGSEGARCWTGPTGEFASF